MLPYTSDYHEQSTISNIACELPHGRIYYWFFLLLYSLFEYRALIYLGEPGT